MSEWRNLRPSRRWYRRTARLPSLRNEGTDDVATTTRQRQQRQRDDFSVRISKATVAKLQLLADEKQLSVSAIIDAAVEEYRRQWIFDQADAAYRALRADPEAWAAELAERREWDVTLMDGLEDDE